MRLNDLYDFSSTSVVNYDIVMRQLDFLDHILVGEKPLRFNQNFPRSIKSPFQDKLCLSICDAF